MSRVFVCLFVLFFLSIAVQFGDCENAKPECQDENIKPGSDKVRLSPLEAAMKGIKSPFDKMNDYFGKNKKDSQESSGDDSRENSQEESQKDSEERGSLNTKLNAYKDKMKAIFPGTKWCGDGDIAKNDTDIGKFKQVDACCREHDKCSNNIVAGQMLGNLMNDGLFTKSACTCDFKFHACLKNTSRFLDRMIAKEIGITYFNRLQPQCFRCMCPAEGCNLEETSCMNSCKKYEWVDNNKFTKSH